MWNSPIQGWSPDPSQTHIQWLMWVKWPRCEANHSSSFNVEIWSSTSSPPLHHYLCTLEHESTEAAMDMGRNVSHPRRVILTVFAFSLKPHQINFREK